MHASVLHEIGEEAVLVYTSVITPKPSADEVIVKVLYCGLNHLDLHIRYGRRPGPSVFPHILGSEIVGTIASVPDKKSGFSKGDVVTIYPWTFCGKCKQCKEERENICNNSGTFGRTCWGGYAEYVVAPIKNLVKIPKGLDPKVVCASTLSAITAYHMIYDRAKIPDGSSVLVTAATGGVGTAAIQMLAAKKCSVIATTSHEPKIERLKKLGARHVVSVKKMREEILALFPDGIEYVVDAMGGQVWSEALLTLAQNGTIVFCATTLDAPGQVPIGIAFNRQLNILGSYGGTRKNLQSMIDLVNKGIIKPVIDEIFPLKDADIAQEKLEQQKAFGKILLSPGKDL